MILFCPRATSMQWAHRQLCSQVLQWLGSVVFFWLLVDTIYAYSVGNGARLQLSINNITYLNVMFLVRYVMYNNPVTSHIMSDSEFILKLDHKAAKTCPDPSAFWNVVCFPWLSARSGLQHIERNHPASRSKKVCWLAGCYGGWVPHARRSTLCAAGCLLRICCHHATWTS